MKDEMDSVGTEENPEKIEQPDDDPVDDEN